MTRINFAVLSPGLSTAYLEFARDNGLFSRRGIDLKIQYFLGGGNEGNAAIASGQIDAGSYGPPVLTAIVRGLKIKIVASTSDTNTMGSVLAGRLSIKTVEDLRGKVVATSQKGQSPYQHVITILENHGLSASDVKIRPAQSGSLQLLKAGQADAVLLGDLDLAFAVQNGFAHPLDTSGKYLGTYQSGYIFSTQKLIDTKPEVVRNLISAIIEANQQAITRFEDLFNYAKAKYPSPYKQDDIRSYMKKMLLVKNLSCQIYPHAVRNYLQYMVNWGDFKQTEIDTLTDAKLFDLRFITSEKK